MEVKPVDKGQQGFVNLEDQEKLFEEIAIEQICRDARPQMQAFLVGFRELLRKRHDTFQGYTQSELEKLIGGVSVIDLYVLISTPLDRFQDAQTFCLFPFSETNVLKPPLTKQTEVQSQTPTSSGSVASSAHGPSSDTVHSSNTSPEGSVSPRPT